MNNLNLMKKFDYLSGKKHFDDPNMINGFYVESDTDNLTVQFLRKQVMIAVVESEMRYGYDYWFNTDLEVEAYNEIFPNNCHLYIKGFHVNKEFRNKGIGSKTIQRYFKEYSKSEFANYPIVLHAIPEQNTVTQSELIEIYKHFGFQVINGNLLVLTPIDLSDLK